MGLTQRLGTIPLAIQTDSSNNVGIGGAAEAGWILKSTGNTKISSGSGTTVLQVNDTSTGGKAWSLISAGAGNAHSVPAGTFYLRNSSDGITSLSVSSGGNVGIGTSSPAAPLTIKANTSGDGIRLVGRSDGFAFLSFRNNADSATNGEIGISDAKNMLFYTDNTERMRITSGGAVQLSKGQLEFTGTNGGVELGTTVGIIKYDNSNVAFYYGTGDLIFKTNSNQVGDIMFLKQDGTLRLAKYTSNGTLTTTSSNGTIAVSSDKNMKIDAGLVENGLDKVLSLKPRYFYWKDEEKFGNKKQLGFYAQEVNEVSEEASNTPEEGQGWGIYDRALIALLVKAIQELSAKVTALEKKA